jgi:excisionase family DNA binding protein
MSEKLLSYRAFAERLGVAPVTVRKWAALRMISTVKLGKRAVRIKESELVRLIERGTTLALENHR